MVRRALALAAVVLVGIGLFVTVASFHATVDSVEPVQGGPTGATLTSTIVWPCHAPLVDSIAGRGDCRSASHSRLAMGAVLIITGGVPLAIA
jgi:hypothetical protein